MVFKKFTKEEHVSSVNQVKSSIARGIRSSIAETYPWLDENGVLDVLVPKKETFYVAKCAGHVQMVVINDTPLFFSPRDGPWCPTLRVLHQYPEMMPKLRVDTGAIKFVLSGADVMCPGLTSPGATIHNEVEEGTAVAIMAEDKVTALAVGVTTMSTQEIRDVNKGVGLLNLHCLNDGLWKLKDLK